MQEFEGFVKMSKAEYNAAKKIGEKIFGIDTGIAPAGSIGRYRGKVYLAMKDTYEYPTQNFVGSGWKLIYVE